MQNLGTSSGEDIKTVDTGAADPTPEQVKSFFGNEPPAAPAPASVTVTNDPLNMTSGSSSTTVTVQPEVAPANIPLQPGQYGTFPDTDTMYKSWRESSKKISQDGEEKKRLAQQLEQERQMRQQYEQQLRQSAPPAAQPSLSKEQYVERFVNDPTGWEESFEQKIAQKYMGPIVQTLQEMYRKQQELSELEAIPSNDRTLYTQFQQDGMFDAMRQNPRYQRFSNAELLELGKAQMIQHQVSALQAQVNQGKAAQASKNARAVVESGGSTSVPAKTTDQMDEKELKDLARLSWDTGERF